MTVSATTQSPSDLSSSLEDYLETIFELVREKRVARVRDIAEARNVKAASVSPALRKLASLGLIEYTEREFIGLTPKGEVAARRVLARHTALTDFLHQVLGMTAAQASSDACAMEHSLSDEGMSHLTSFLEYLQMCPEAGAFLRHYRDCGHMSGNTRVCDSSCQPAKKKLAQFSRTTSFLSLAELPILAAAKVKMVQGAGALRQRLLDLGLLPGANIQVLRAAPASGPLWIQLDGSQLSLRRSEAEVVLVEPIA